LSLEVSLEVSLEAGTILELSLPLEGERQAGPILWSRPAKASTPSKIGLSTKVTKKLEEKLVVTTG